MNLNSGMAGYFILQAVNVDTGTVRHLAEFENLILDAGLERMGTGDYLDVCRIGSGNSVPTVLQTALDNKIASTNSVQSGVYGAQGTAPYYGWKKKTFRFNAGVATGNLSEVGVGWGNTTTDGFLYSRALIKDGNGDPTTITVLADEFLDVTYELRLYPNLTDVTITGLDLGQSTHDVTIRAAEVTSAIDWGAGLGRQVVLSSERGYSGDSKLYNGAIGVITGTPSGASVAVDANTAGYQANSKKQQGVMSLSLNQVNLADGIKSVLLRSKVGAYQFEFNPPINKTSEKTLTLNFEVSWGRHVA